MYLFAYIHIYIYIYNIHIIQLFILSTTCTSIYKCLSCQQYIFIHIYIYLLTRFDLRIRLTGPIPYSATPQTGISAQLKFLSSGETGTGARPTPGDHSHRPPPGWVGGNNKQSARIYAHRQPNAAAAMSLFYSTIACT